GRHAHRASCSAPTGVPLVRVGESLAIVPHSQEVRLFNSRTETRLR
ncbi:ABC transporter, partial [Mycobacterium tuberculosis '98-R604 INH-RIF-EM']